MRKFVWLLIPTLVALTVWLPGIDWGLPTRQTDAALFGDRVPWSGVELLALLPADDVARLRGADVDATPIAPNARPVLLNGTDADRAVIVRRYRLQSKQPDEFINFKAIAEMARRGDFDPRLYQYGGLWLYPLAGALKAGSWLGLVELRGDMAFYLDHPEAFGRFYVVARLMSIAWGLLGVLAICWIVRRATDDPLLGTLAGIGFAAIPIVVNAAHEAKPHLAGTALMLLSVIAATRFVEQGRRRDATLAGLASGAAASMVVSAILGLVVLPAMALLRRESTRRRSLALLLSLASAAAVYTTTNPFVLYNALTRPELLTSNLGNSAAMYSIGLAGLTRAITLLAMGGTVVLLVMASVGLVAMTIRLLRHDRVSSANDNAAPLLLAAPALLVLAQFILLASGKPAEYVRFALLPCSAMVATAVVGIHRMVRSEAWSHRVTALLVGCIVVLGGLQTSSFVMEQASGRDVDLAPLRQRSGATVALAYEPAPWSCPPIDLFNHSLVLLPERRVPGDPETRGFDLAVAPANLASQVGLSPAEESFNWSANRWLIRGSGTSRIRNGE